MRPRLQPYAPTPATLCVQPATLHMYLHTHLQALQLFPWHFEMARSAEEATWQLRRALRGGGGLAEVMQPPRPRAATTCHMCMHMHMHMHMC